MKKVYIPKGETVTYDQLNTVNIVVKGTLIVKGKLTAKFIQGGGRVEAEEIQCDTIEVDTVQAEIVTARKVVGKKLFIRDIVATDAVMATDFIESLHVLTKSLYLTLSSISQCDAEEIIMLSQKKRGLLGMLFASKALSAPFPVEDIEWRVQNTTNDKARGMAVAYLTSRAIQKRLDEAVGPYNWKSEFKPWHLIGNNPSQICGLSLFDEVRKEWITKWDGAENIDFESVKGGISDAFKRAAVLWGIGRYLYSIDSVWVDIEPSGKSFKIKQSEQKRLDKQYSASFEMPSGTAPTVIKEKPVPQFDYVVKSVEQKNTSTVITMIKPNSKSEIVAFVQGKPVELAEGVCLKDVKITSRAQNGNTPAYNTIDSYKIAA